MSLRMRHTYVSDECRVTLSHAAMQAWAEYWYGPGKGKQQLRFFAVVRRTAVEVTHPRLPPSHLHQRCLGLCSDLTTLVGLRKGWELGYTQRCLCARNLLCARKTIFCEGLRPMQFMYTYTCASGMQYIWTCRTSFHRTRLVGCLLTLL